MTIRFPKIQRIYVSRGDNLYDDEGRKCDKFCGIMVNGGIYWIDTSFATLEQLGWQLIGLNVAIDNRGKWGVYSGSAARLDHNVTKIKQHHDDIFKPKTIYRKNAVMNGDKLWWDLSELIEHLGEPIDHAETV